MGRRGRKRELEVEARYWALLASGVGTVAACRQVGITRKTGYRWRAEAGGLAPARLAEAVRSNRYLSLLERQRIAALRGQGVGVREIGRRLGRDPSTVSRELVRNTAKHDKGGRLRRAARARPGQVSRCPTGALTAGPGPGLAGGSGGQAGAGMEPRADRRSSAETYPDTPSWHLCHETIYQALYRGARGGLSRKYAHRLRTGRPLRKRRRRGDERRTRYVVAHQNIQARPAIVTERSRVGDWEGDLIVGTASKSAVATLVDRRSGYLRLVHLPYGHRAEQLVTALRTALAPMSADRLLTLTWDQGSEMAHHEQVAELFSGGVFFANPGCPWMRGTNENTNGLIRQYLPKGTDLRAYDAAALTVIEDKLNNRPRKRLGWRTPSERFDVTS